MRKQRGFGRGCGSAGPLVQGWRGVSPQAVLAIRTTESSPKAKAGDGLSVTRKES